MSSRLPPQPGEVIDRTQDEGLRAQLMDAADYDAFCAAMREV